METASKTDSTALPIFVGLAGSVWLNTYIVGLMILILEQKRRIKLMNAYQINNGLDNSLEAFNVCIQFETASETDSMAKTDDILRCCCCLLPFLIMI